MMSQRFGMDTKVFLSWACSRICLNNSYLFKVVEWFFRVNGYQLSDNIHESDVVILNTCGYTDEVAEENVNFVSSVREQCSDKNIIVFGCLTKLSDEIKEDDTLILVGPNQIHMFSELFVNNIKCGDASYLPYARPANTPEMLDEENQGFIQISEGCSNTCSYCNIKIAKGFVKSKAVSTLVEEAAALASRGVRDITLLADDCGSYGHDIGTNLPELVAHVLKSDENLRVKIYTIYPDLFLRYFPALEGFYSSGKITYTCLPLQSGSKRVLKLMNRNYNLEKIVDLVIQIKQHGPQTRMFTHFIINFPSETTEEFQKSLELAPFFDYTLLLPYGENHRTQASAITERCTHEQMTTKVEMAERAIEKGDFKGLVVV